MDTSFKIIRLFAFALVSLVFIPMVLIVHFGTDLWEDWLGKIMKW